MGLQIQFRGRDRGSKKDKGQSKSLIMSVIRQWKFILFVLLVFMFFFYPEKLFEFVFDIIYKFQELQMGAMM